MGITSTTGTSSLSSENATKRIAIVNTWTYNDLTSGETAGTVKIRYQYSNHLGSASLELNDVGEFVSYQEYFPFGETAYTLGEVSTEYRFTGKERDSFTGLYYFGARYYAPWMFRWMNPDPSGPVDGLNVFVYCTNRPIVCVDPDGRESLINRGEQITMAHNIGEKRENISSNQRLPVNDIMATNDDDRPDEKMISRDPLITDDQQWYYGVVKGDCLSSISERCGVPVEELVRLNNIQDPDHIEPGQVLKVNDYINDDIISKPGQKLSLIDDRHDVEISKSNKIDVEEKDRITIKGAGVIGAKILNDSKVISENVEEAVDVHLGIDSRGDKTQLEAAEYVLEARREEKAKGLRGRGKGGGKRTHHQKKLKASQQQVDNLKPQAAKSATKHKGGLSALPVIGFVVDYVIEKLTNPQNSEFENIFNVVVGGILITAWTASVAAAVLGGTLTVSSGLLGAAGIVAGAAVIGTAVAVAAKGYYDLGNTIICWIFNKPL